MNPRNLPYGNERVMELEPLQRQREPYLFLGSPSHFSHPNIHQNLPPPPGVFNFDSRNLPEHVDGSAFYSAPQYAHRVNPTTNLELGIPTPSNFYHPHANPTMGRMVLPSSSNFGPTSAHVDGFRGFSKRNGAEGSMRNTHYINAHAAPNLLMPPLNACHFDGGVAVVDACLPLPEYGGNFMGQSFQPNSNLSFDLSLMSPFSQDPASSSEIRNVNGQRFHDGASTSHVPANFLHSPPPHHLPHDFHHLQNVHGASRYGYNYHHPAVAASNGNHMSNVMYNGSTSHMPPGRNVGPPPPGIRIYRSSRRSVTPEDISRHPDLPHLRYLPEEGLAILEFPGHYEMGLDDNTPDHHRDMRLDIDYMSYEELLALSERIGDVSTGLSDEVIISHLKTRVHRSPLTAIDLEALPSCNEINDSCVICQDEYEDGDSVGSLDCGHEYHSCCLKKWLAVKNACPICKSTALKLQEKRA